MKVTSFLAVGATLISTVVGFGDVRLHKQSKPQVDAKAAAQAIPPSKDPWYKAPAGFEEKAPGTILKIRAAAEGTVKTIANSSAAWNILYRTTDSHDKPTFAVTTFFVPKTKPDGTKLLSYQIPYDSANVDASPSYTFNTQTEDDISKALGKGWYVNSPDYEGPLASFTAGLMSGYATLDSVRAVLAAKKGVNKSKTRYALWGYSGGALASEWAGELQGAYAPGLKFAGAALGGLTPNVTNVVYTVDGTVYAGLIPAGILGVASQYPALTKYLNSTLKKTGKYNITGFYQTKHLDLYGAVGTYAGQKMGEYFTNGLKALNSPIAKQVIARDGIMGKHGQPNFPLFVYKAIADDISPTGDTDALVKQYCASKPQPSIKYERNTVGNHLTEETNGDARSFAFLTNVLSGTYKQQGCLIRNVTVGK